MDKYYKNFILCGEIDYYCLLCQERFEAESDVEKHMRWEVHRKVIKTQDYVHKYKKDFIYKISDYYYCEVCNLTTTNIAEHIIGNDHQTQKINPNKVFKKSSLVFPETNGMVKVKDAILTKLQWHGIKDGNCSLCSLSLKTSFNHMMSAEHMLNLIQSIVKCENGYCYRQLNSGKFYCFTCFETADNKYLSKHWIDKQCEKTNREHHFTENKNKETKQPKSDVNNMFRMLQIYGSESKHYKIDLKNKIAHCLICKLSVEVTSKALHEHELVCHPDSLRETVYLHFDHGKRRANVAKYGKENYIKLNEGGSKGYCSLCNIYISAHINCAKEHVEGSQHRGYLEIKGLVKDSVHTKPSCKIIPYKSFVTDMYGPFRIVDYNVVVFNEGICVDVISVSLIGVIQDFRDLKCKCFACDLTFNLDEIQKHTKEKGHENLMMQCKVVSMNYQEEFVRQIHPSLYHCGYCNKVYPFWENMEKHLKSLKHLVEKTKKKILSKICANVILNPLQDIEDMEEYITLKSLDY